MDDRTSEDMRYYLEAMGEQYRLEMETNQLQLESLSEENELLKTQNKDLRKAYERKSRTSTLMFAGGLAVGMAVTLGFTKLVIAAVD